MKNVLYISAGRGKMYYLKINGQMQPQKFQLVSEAKAELERLRQEMTINSWNILTEKSAAYEVKSMHAKWQFSAVEKIFFLGLLLLIFFAGVFFVLRGYNKTIYYVEPELVNYRNETGNILGQLSKGAAVECVQITENRCQTYIKGQTAYIYLNVLKQK